MTKDEIFVDREFTARKLLRNLHKYGTIFPAGHYFRGIHGSIQETVSMSRANYLRYAACLTENTDKNEDHHHYVSLLEAAAQNIAVDMQESPVYLEHWQGSAQTGYNVTLEPYYKAEELSVQTWENTSTNLTKLMLELGANKFATQYDLETLRRNPNEYGNALREFATAKAQENGHNGLTAKAFAQVALAEFGIKADYENKPLFSSEELLTFEANPLLLFETFSKATDLVAAMQREYTAQREEDQRQENEEVHQAIIADDMADSAMSEDVEKSPDNAENLVQAENSGLFAGLKIHLEWTDSPLYNFDGKMYESNTTLIGEAAYEFLVKFNQMDKDMFNGCYPECDGKSRLSIEYNGYKHNDGESFRIDLGDLELGNASSIYEALKYRLLLNINGILNDDHLAKMHMDFHGAEADETTISELRAECNKEKETILSKLDEFRQEEQKYYRVDTVNRMKSINEQDAKPFLYIMQRFDYENEPVSRNNPLVRPIHQYTMGEVPAEKLGEYCVLPPKEYKKTLKALATSEEKATEIDERYLKVRNKLPDNMMVIASRNSPDSEVFEDSAFIAAIPKERIDRLKDLQRFQITVKELPTALSIYKDTEKTFQGYEAVKMLESYIEDDAKVYNEALRQGYYQPALEPQYHLAIFWDGHETYQLDYKNGEGTLAKAYNNPMAPMLPDEGRRIFSNSLREAGHLSYDMIALRWCGSLNEGDWPSPKQGREQFLQSDMYKSLMKNKPVRIGRDYAYDCMEIFKQLTAIEPDLHTPKEFWTKVAVNMATAGFKTNQINTIGKCITQTRPKAGEILQRMSKSSTIKEIQKTEQMVR